MPSIEDWHLTPLQTIQSIYESNKDDVNWLKHVEEYFSEKLPTMKQLKALSSLNDVSLHELRGGQLVCFRCMIQETFEPEYFPTSYEIVNKKDGSKVSCTSAYRDVIDCTEDFEILESSTRQTSCRQLLYCISVPGENRWVKENYKMNHLIRKTSVHPTTSAAKRSLEEDETMEEDIPMSNEMVNNKKQRSQGAAGNDNSRSILKKNHPIPNEDGPVCIVKVYDENKEFKVNEIYEFVGVLSVDPSLSHIFDNGTDGMDEEFMEEQRARHPPPSFVPRLHCVRMFKLDHNNPFIHFNEVLASDMVTRSIRSEIISFLKQATFGDELTAEYLLMHLSSGVYARIGSKAVGKLSLNIFNIPANSPYPRLLSCLLKEMVTKTYYLPMTLENMNNFKFIPTKNYSTNRLETGILQLSDGTHLIVDECVLKPGELNADGVKHVQALATLLNSQQVDYNFQFHPLVFHHDIPVLVISEGRSMFPCDCQIPLRPEIAMPNDMEGYFQQLHTTKDSFDKFRSYLSLTRSFEYELEESMTKVIENDFVAARQHDQDKMTADDLHLNLMVGRLMSTGAGHKHLSVETWRRVWLLENERKRRLLAR